VAQPSGPIGLVSVPAPPVEAAEAPPPDAANESSGIAHVVRLGTGLSSDIAVTESGIALIYRALDRLVDELSLDDAALVVDDPDLGRQVFRAGRRGLRDDEMRLVDAPAGLYTSPPMPNTSFDASLLASLSLLAVRLDLQRYDAAHDPLTGLYARAMFNRLLDTAMARSRRLGWQFSLVLIDLDDLKAVNDNHGHPAGDIALRAVAEFLRRALRHSDEAARIGGDEFALILPETDPSQVERIFERVASVDDAPVPAFSYGVAVCPTDAANPAELLARADERLYDAKRLRRA
jgi:diguanylate cyclase (GGDEF)-like protein